MASHVTSQPGALASESARPVARVEPRAALRWATLAAVSLAGVLVFWLFDAMPFQDLPAHAGLIAMRHRFADSAFDQRYFVFAPHIGPYSLFRFLGEAFVPLLGPTGTVRALATLPALATPAAVIFARRALHGDRSLAFGYFGVALSYGLMTLLGFASYLLGAAVMLVALTFWLRLLARADDARASTFSQEVAMAAIAPLVFVAHGHAFVLFLVLAFVSAVATGARWRRLLRLRALVPALALAAYVAWLERAGAVPAGSVPVPGAGNLAPRFQTAFDKFSLLITPTLMTRMGVDFVVGVVVWILVIAATVATVAWLRKPATPAALRDEAAPRAHSKALYACAAAMIVVFAVLPHAVGWFGFVDGRLVPLVLLLGVMAVRTEALAPWLRATIERCAPLLAAAVVAIGLVASYRFQDEARGYKEILAQVPAEATVLNLPVDPNSDVFTAHPFIHYDKLVLADRPAVVSDMWFHQGSAIYPREGNPALRLPPTYSESDLHVIDWGGYELSDWDYVLIRTRPGAPQPPVPSSLVVADHRGGWWLFTHAADPKRSHPPPAR
jgi:hypothetical protein